MARKRSYDHLLKTIATNLKRARKQKGFTQEKMAEMGFNYRFYQKLESGTYSPNLRTLFKAAEILDLTILELLKEQS